MMLYPPVPKMLESVGSRYLLVNVIARRARQVAIEAEEFKVPLDKKPVSQAIEEIADGLVTATVKEEYLR
jgi:DNA-directed RNA polymerase subunit omega